MYCWKTLLKVEISIEQQCIKKLDDGSSLFGNQGARYTRVQNVCPGSKTAGNQSNHQNFDPTLLNKKLWPFNMRMKQKKFKMAAPKKLFFKIANSRNFFVKISEIGPWVSRIERCEGHWCSSMYMAVRLSDKSSKTAKKQKKCIFSHFRAYVGQPQCHIGWATSTPFASINPTM